MVTGDELNVVRKPFEWVIPAEILNVLCKPVRMYNVLFILS